MLPISRIFGISRRDAMKFLLPLMFIATAMTPALAAENIPFTAATVEEKDGTFTVEWRAVADVTSVTIYSGPTPGEINRAIPLGKGSASGKVSLTPPAFDPPAARRYFELVPDRGQPLVVAERALRLATAPNFRDVGGYRTTDGKWVRTGMLYRSDQLNLLSDADLGTLRNMGIRLVCDLRTESERKGPGADRLPAGAKPLIADVTGDNPDSALAVMINSPDKVRLAGPQKMQQEMANVYRQLVSSKTAQDAYRSMFERLANPIYLPAIFHCTAGKDRTGWASAVFLSIMGVPRDVIVADYMVSNTLLSAKNAKMLAAMPDPVFRAAIEPLAGVSDVYINAAFDEVTKRFGTFENYLAQGLKLDAKTLELLRRLYIAG